MFFFFKWPFISWWLSSRYKHVYSTTSRDFLPPSPFFSPFSQVVCPVATFWLRIDILGISNYPHGKDHEAKARTTANGRQHPARVLLSAASVAFKTLLCAPFPEVEQIQHGQRIELADTGDVVKGFLDYLVVNQKAEEAKVEEMKEETLRLDNSSGLAVAKSDLLLSLGASAFFISSEIAALDAVELLQLANAYEVKQLVKVMESNLFECLDSSLSLQVLIQSTRSGESRTLWRAASVF